MRNPALFSLVLATLATLQTAAQKTSFSAGFSRTNITPAWPVPMSGYGDRKGLSKGVHDSLYVRATAFSDGTNKALILSAEVIGLSHAFWKEVTDSIEKSFGIKKEYVMLAAVHNHSGPVTRVYNEDSSEAVVKYVEVLKSKIIEAAGDALNSLAPADIGTGKGICKMNINRRASNGKGETTLGRNPYAPCDHEVAVLKVSDKSGRAKGLMINWPCHAVVLGQNNYLITSDWPGAASKYVEDKLDNGVVSQITVGASGDINPIYGPGDFDGGESFARDAVGEDLALEALRVANNIKGSDGGRITAMQREINLPRKPNDNKEDSLMVRLSVIKIGKIVLTGVSGELFNQISVNIRKQSKYPFTIMITHCNGSSGYLVTDDAYPVEGVPQMQNKAKPTGGYETNTTRVSSGAERAITDNLIQMVNNLNK
jgi:neutral ceramidase